MEGYYPHLARVDIERFKDAESYVALDQYERCQGAVLFMLFPSESCILLLFWNNILNVIFSTYIKLC